MPNPPEASDLAVALVTAVIAQDSDVQDAMLARATEEQTIGACLLLASLVAITVRQTAEVEGISPEEVWQLIAPALKAIASQGDDEVAPE
ncbi:hypothetical protein EPO04_03520 [Patescibacteria group bacterium]|nr:MAG: hypothetical protein EPO04_03520 [Patescibacteria group bacterium]